MTKKSLPMLPLVITGGIITGMVAFLIHISHFFSYLSDNPNACMNCHVMTSEYAGWLHSSHREVANCQDCHVPHNTVFHKYAFKAMDGLRHSAIFTLNLTPDAILMHEAGQEVVQNNCIRCHGQLWTKSPISSHYWTQYPESRRCWDCHRTTPHGEVRSLGSHPMAQVPSTKSMIPLWIKEFMRQEQQLKQNRRSHNVKMDSN